MDCSSPGLPVHHQLPEFTQTHVHWIGDAIQPSHPLSSPSPLPSIFPSIRVFSNESVLHIRWSKYWSFSFSISPASEHSGLIAFLTSPISQQGGGAQLPPLLPVQVSLPFQILLIKQRPQFPRGTIQGFYQPICPCYHSQLSIIWSIF